MERLVRRGQLCIATVQRGSRSTGAEGAVRSCDWNGSFHSERSNAEPPPPTHTFGTNTPLGFFPTNCCPTDCCPTDCRLTNCCPRCCGPSHGRSRATAAFGLLALLTGQAASASLVALTSDKAGLSTVVELMHTDSGTSNVPVLY